MAWGQAPVFSCQFTPVSISDAPSKVAFGIVRVIIGTYYLMMETFSRHAETEMPEGSF